MNKENMEQINAFERIKDLDTLIDAFMTMGSYEKQHSLGVRDKTIFVLAKMQKEAPELIPDGTNLNNIIVAAWFHDIGKLMTPPEVLNKNGKLTDQEFAEMKNHTLHTETALKKVAEFKGKNEIINAATHHHEALNGFGYPYGLKEDNLNFGAKLLRIIDCYDAMTMDRQYRKGMDINTTLKFLSEDVQSQKIDGKLFDFVSSTIINAPQQQKEKIAEGKRETYLADLKYLLNNEFLRTPEPKFYYPELGLDDAKTAEGHYKDLRYYVQDGNIPAIEKIQEICEEQNMPFEADMCEFAKESVLIDKDGKMPYNIADIKKDMAESLRDYGRFYSEIEFNEGNQSTNIHLSARLDAHNKDINKAEISIMLFETTNVGEDNAKESFGAARVSFEDFKQMPQYGFHIEHQSFNSLLNEIRAYFPASERVKPWSPQSPVERNNIIEKESQNVTR